MKERNFSAAKILWFLISNNDGSCYYVGRGQTTKGMSEGIRKQASIREVSAEDQILSSLTLSP